MNEETPVAAPAAMSLEQLHDWLKDQGFSFGRQTRQMNECDWYAWRRSALPARPCDCNGPGLQLVINPYAMRLDGTLHESVEVEVTGEAGEIWWKLLAYSMKPADLVARLTDVEAALVAAWNAVQPENVPAQKAEALEAEAAIAAKGLTSYSVEFKLGIPEEGPFIEVRAANALQAKILAQAERIKRGFDYQVEHIWVDVPARKKA